MKPINLTLNKATIRLSALAVTTVFIGLCVATLLTRDIENPDELASNADTLTEEVIVTPTEKDWQDAYDASVDFKSILPLGVFDQDLSPEDEYQHRAEIRVPYRADYFSQG